MAFSDSSREYHCYIIGLQWNKGWVAKKLTSKQTEHTGDRRNAHFNVHTYIIVSG